MGVVLSHPDYEDDLRREVSRSKAFSHFEPISKGVYQAEIDAHSEFAKHNRSLVWARDEWREIEILKIDSIAQAVSELRSRYKGLWFHVTTSSHRRGELIESHFATKTKLEKIHGPREAWPLRATLKAERSRVQPAFTLLDPGRIALCLAPREEVPGGDWVFAEDRKGPPSRAYLKLWEWGWRTDRVPKEGESALDLGASPGGWTWVLLKAGLRVEAFDRSPLKLELTSEESSRVRFHKGDAFQITPEGARHRGLKDPDWVFCDVIAEPKRSRELIESWLSTQAGLVFTIKFKGETDFATIEMLSRVPQARLWHLNVNKHEVTFFRPPVSN